MKRFAALTLALLAISTPCRAELTTKYDKFKDRTFIKTPDMYCGWGCAISSFQAYYSFPGQTISPKDTTVIFSFTYNGKQWRYLYDYDLVILADGDRITPTHSSRDRQIYSGSISEWIDAHISLEDFLKIAKASTVEAKLGAYEFSFTPKMRKEMLLLANLIPDHSDHATTTPNQTLPPLLH
jgi:hypothetical protein